MNLFRSIAGRDASMASGSGWIKQLIGGAIVLVVLSGIGSWGLSRLPVAAAAPARPTSDVLLTLPNGTTVSVDKQPGSTTRLGGGLFVKNFGDGVLELRNGLLRTKVGDASGRYKLQIGGVEKVFADVDLKPFQVEALIFDDHYLDGLFITEAEVAALEESGVLQHFGVSRDTAAKSVATRPFDTRGSGDAPLDTSQTGYANTIGPNPLVATLALVSSSPQVIGAAISHALESGNYPAFRHDETTLEVPLLGRYPHLSSDGSTTGEYMASEAGPGQNKFLDIAHQPHWHFIPVLILKLRGRTALANLFIERMHNMLSYSTYKQNDAYRGFEKHYFFPAGSMQARGAWHLIELARQVLEVTDTGHPYFSGALQVFRNNLYLWHGTFVRGDFNPAKENYPFLGPYTWDPARQRNTGKNDGGYIYHDDGYGSAHGISKGVAWQTGFAQGFVQATKSKKIMSLLTAAERVRANEFADHLIDFRVKTLGGVNWQAGSGVYGFYGWVPASKRFATYDEAWSAYYEGQGIARPPANGNHLYIHDTPATPTPEIWTYFPAYHFALLSMGVDRGRADALVEYRKVIGTPEYAAAVRNGEADRVPQFAIFPKGCTHDNPLLCIDGTRGLPRSVSTSPALPPAPSAVPAPLATSAKTPPAKLPPAPFDVATATKAADENASFYLSKPARVWYGARLLADGTYNGITRKAGSYFTFKDFSQAGRSVATNAEFGSDPCPGVVKAAYVTDASALGLPSATVR